MSTNITSPIKGFSETTHVGALKLEFKDGTAAVDDLSDGQRAYLLSAGYTVDGTSVDSPASLDGSDLAPAGSVDSRDLATPDQVGEPLRDAAVDPEEGDFLAPTNAGKADPHGPDVVSPEVHASQGVRPVLGGDVHVDDPAVQDKQETAHAADATDGTPLVTPEQPKPEPAKKTAAKKAPAKKTPAKKV